MEGLLSGAYLAVELLSAGVRERLELAYTVRVDVWVILNTTPGIHRYHVFDVLTDAVVVAVTPENHASQ